jgi:glycosyltransferase involved in cell wall biosynthesis
MLSVRYSNSVYLDSWRDRANIRDFLPRMEFRGKNYLLEYLNRIETRKRIKEEEFDIFHPTFYWPVGKIRGNKPVVVTVHDMTHEIYPEYFVWYDQIARQKRKITRLADRVIAISENTKRDLIQYHRIPEEKIEVIHHGFNKLEEVGQSVEIPGKYLLYVGNRGGYKNFLFFLEAVSPILIQEKLRLVCAGGGRFSHAERKEISRLGVSHLLTQFEISPGQLAFLYRNAIAFVFPSLYEGFGMPVLEAFSAGCPVILSNVSSFPEVAGDAGVYFDPRDAHSIYEAVKGVLSDGNLRTILKNSGIERLQEFSWKNTAEKTMTVYKKLLG